MSASIASLKRVLLLRLSGLLLILAVVLLYSNRTIDGVILAGRQEMGIINATGRLRMLVQQFVRQANLALIGLSISDWKILLEQRELSLETSTQFEQTIQSLLQGGEVRWGSSSLVLSRVEAPEVRAHLEEIETLWGEVKRASVKVLRSDNNQLRDHPDLALMQTAATRLVEKVDETLLLMQQRDIRRTDLLVFYQTGLLLGGIAMFLFLAVFVYRRIIAPLSETIQKLDLSEEQHRNLYDAAPVGLWKIEFPGGSFLKANRVMAQLFGLASESVPMNQRNIFTRFPLGKSDLFIAELARHNEVIDFEITSRAVEGEEKSLLLSARNYPEKGFAEGVVIDVTARKNAERELKFVHKELLEISRQAGMAEVATGVLHNVGNVLNSVNISSAVVVDNVRRSKAGNLSKVVALLREHETDLGAFMTRDPKGQQLPGYLAQLAEHLAHEQTIALEELARLQKNIGHIKDVVAMQQNYAKVSGVMETVTVNSLMEDALQMNASSLMHHDVEVIREFEETPLITVDKHKVLQILVNLMRNAMDACDESGREEKCLVLRVSKWEDCVRMVIVDNGIGIPAENLTRIFEHGFTTKKTGHGFGLHSAALTAREMGGSLAAYSSGWGQGTTFTLEMPYQSVKESS